MTICSLQPSASPCSSCSCYHKAKTMQRGTQPGTSTELTGSACLHRLFCQTPMSQGKGSTRLCASSGTNVAAQTMTPTPTMSSLGRCACPVRYHNTSKQIRHPHQVVKELQHNISFLRRIGLRHLAAGVPGRYCLHQLTPGPWTMVFWVWLDKGTFGAQQPPSQP